MSIVYSCQPKKNSSLFSSTRNTFIPNTAKNLSEKQWDSVQNTSNKILQHPKSKRNSNNKILGWHIYSNGTSYKNYNFKLLWGISYFSYVINPLTGASKNKHHWKTTALIDSAKVHGCKVFLSVSNFGAKSNSQFLNNTKAQETLINNLVELLDYRKADGINIDFEGVAKKDKKLFTSFINRISKKLKKVNPNYLVTLCLYANDWHRVFDIKNIQTSVDFYTLMGYDYYGNFSKIAGPISPLKNSQKFGNGLEHSVTHYIQKGVTPAKLIVGLPYYGGEWYTKSESVPSKVVKYKSSPTYSTIKRIYIDSLKVPVNFHAQSGATYLSFKENNAYRQLWFENPKSLALKYDWIKKNKLAGVGIWALGYDDGYADLWNLLSEKFSEQTP
ncbi:glycoside hydrolase family 18 protein [uncultured Tenacibaculum sp.]|uniref:glycoside hydrolase family 18 protein n=1 Tax=uncultured Tenacibaculum sp. TaxID=174713 RepID=UPI00262A5139|nr:glycoside hydrolase family 18 protein [uncultured Tenacibaculum sp.]